MLAACMVIVYACSGGARISQEAAPIPEESANLFLTNFPRNLHENEEILGQRGAYIASPLDPPLVRLHDLPNFASWR